MEAALRQKMWRRWGNFDLDRTIHSGKEFIPALLEDNHVSCSLPGGVAHQRVVGEITRNAEQSIPIDTLSPVLKTISLPRGRVVFGSSWDQIDQIAAAYSNMRWWMSESGLRMEVILTSAASPPAAGDSSTFEQTVARLFREAQLNSKTGRLSRQQHTEIAQELDTFKLRDHLTEQYRKTLMEWNQKHPNRPIYTFVQAIEAKNPKGIRRATLQCWYRAMEKVKKAGLSALRTRTTF
jgi:hypothetical protein